MAEFEVQTRERVAFVDITTQVAAAAAESGVRDGVVVVYLPHTTAGVTINENADPSVRADMTLALERLVPESLLFTHLEGNADAHVKASLMGSSVTVPLADGGLRLGTWQGIYFAEFDGPRRGPLNRERARTQRPRARSKWCRRGSVSRRPPPCLRSSFSAVKC
jgi:secondary thiamine-phosphate synthase enzyme